MSMKLSVKQLKRQIREAKKIGASAAYLKKERIREKLQQLIAGSVASGDVTDQAGLDSLIKDVDMALGALRVIPIEVWLRLSGAK